MAADPGVYSDKCGTYIYPGDKVYDPPVVLRRDRSYASLTNASLKAGAGPRAKAYFTWKVSNARREQFDIWTISNRSLILPVGLSKGCETATESVLRTNRDTDVSAQDLLVEDGSSTELYTRDNSYRDRCQSSRLLAPKAQNSELESRMETLISAPFAAKLRLRDDISRCLLDKFIDHCRWCQRLEVSMIDPTIGQATSPNLPTSKN